MGVEWRHDHGRQYLYVDYESTLSEDRMLEIYEEQARQMRLQPHKTRVLSNLTGASVGSRFMERVRAGGEEHGQDWLEKSAFVGVSGLKSILLDGYTKSTHLEGKIGAFDTEAEALDWLFS